MSPRDRAARLVTAPAGLPDTPPGHPRAKAGTFHHVE
jgi:hypothetical protein